MANLPYVAETERAECDPELIHEPQMALFAGILVFVWRVIAGTEAALEQDFSHAISATTYAEVVKRADPGGIPLILVLTEEQASEVYEP